MSNPFSKIGAGLKWLCKEGKLAVTQWVPKMLEKLHLLDDGATNIYHKLIPFFQNVEHLGELAVKDGKGSLAALEVLISKIVAAAKSDGLNVANDLEVGAAFKDVIVAVQTYTHLPDLMTAIKEVIASYDDLASTANHEIQHLLHGDPGSNPTAPSVAPNDPPKGGNPADGQVESNAGKSLSEGAQAVDAASKSNTPDAPSVADIHS